MTEAEVKAAIERASELDQIDAEIALENLAADADYLRSIADVPLPVNLEGAKRAGWIMTLEGIDAANVKIAGHYDDDARRADRQRVVRVRDAAIALLSAEEDLLATEVKSPSDTFLAPYVALWRALAWIFKNRKIIWEAAKRVPGAEAGLIVTVAIVGAALITVVGAALVSADFAASTARLVKARDFHADYLRDKALEQRSQLRYTRLKMAR